MCVCDVILFLVKDSGNALDGRYGGQPQRIRQTRPITMDLLGRNARGLGLPNPDDEPQESLREPPKIPVFVFPASIFFNGTQQKEHQRQILTIYNPYDFPI